jgi:hypothetical protein
MDFCFQHGDLSSDPFVDYYCVSWEWGGQLGAGRSSSFSDAVLAVP